MTAPAPQKPAAPNAVEVARMLARLDAEDIPQRPSWQREQEFIAWARTAVPALSAERAALVAEVAKISGYFDHLHETLELAEQRFNKAEAATRDERYRADAAEVRAEAAEAALTAANDTTAAQAKELARLRYALDGIRVLEPRCQHNGNRNDLIACAAWDIANGALTSGEPR